MVNKKCDKNSDTDDCMIYNYEEKFNITERQNY